MGSSDPIEHDIRKALRKKLDAISGVKLEPGALTRIKRRRLMATTFAGLAIASVVLSGVWAANGISDRSPRQQDLPGASLVPSSSPTGTCEYGPWATHCPEADWARDVIRAAGYAVAGNTGSAIIATSGQYELHLWAFPEEGIETFQEIMEKEGYTSFFSVDGVEVFGDQTRIAWTTHDLFIYLTDATEETLDESDRVLVETFVKASIRTPY